LEPLIASEPKRWSLWFLPAFLSISCILPVFFCRRNIFREAVVGGPYDFEYYCEAKETYEFPHIRCQPMGTTPETRAPEVAFPLNEELLLRSCAIWTGDVSSLKKLHEGVKLDWNELGPLVQKKLQKFPRVNAEEAGLIPADQPAIAPSQTHHQAFLAQNSEVLAEMVSVYPSQFKESPPKLLVVITGGAGVGKSTVSVPILYQFKTSNPGLDVVQIDGELFREKHEGLVGEEGLMTFLRQQTPRSTAKFFELMKGESKDFKNALWAIGDRMGATGGAVLYPTVISDEKRDAKKINELLKEKKFKVVFIECVITDDSMRKTWWDDVSKRGMQSGKPASKKDLDKYEERSSKFTIELQSKADYAELLGIWTQRLVLENRGTKLVPFSQNAEPF